MLQEHVPYGILVCVCVPELDLLIAWTSRKLVVVSRGCGWLMVIPQHWQLKPEALHVFA